jgi:hypothetical protein
MKTVIYLDELLLTNFLAAAALLLGAGLLCARQCSGLRLMAGSGSGFAGHSAAGAARACSFPL